MKKASQPGVEPGSRVPETLVLPLHHWDLLTLQPLSYSYLIIHYNQFESFLKLDVTRSNPHPHG